MFTKVLDTPGIKRFRRPHAGENAEQSLCDLTQTARHAHTLRSGSGRSGLLAGGRLRLRTRHVERASAEHTIHQQLTPPQGPEVQAATVCS